MTDTLTVEECWRYLSRTDIGRLAVAVEDGIDIFPVNYVVHDQAVFFRSAPGSKLMDVAANPQVAFEVDGTRRGRHWSVVVRGAARRLDRDDEIEASGVLGLRTATPTDKWNYVRIDPTTVTGRLL